MFVNECTECHTSQLIFASQVTSLGETGSGTAVAYTCWCGSEQTWVASVAARNLVAA